MEKNNSSRRDFLKKAALFGAGVTILPRHVLGGVGFTAPSDMLNVASVGVGGMGGSDVSRFAASGKANIAYLCDVDTRRAADSVKKFPKAKFYKDFRDMLDKEHKHIDAVSVSTPDHQHAIVALAAMQLGKHVYVQKPLAHDVWEARVLTQAAKKYKVVTQMGNQGASGDGVRQMREWVDAGMIGDLKEIFCWTDRPVWPQGIQWPTQQAPVPQELDWDLWLGTAPKKDYVEKLIPFNWRGWWDYGTGALGDMGCHNMEAPFSIYGLQYVKDVQATVGSVYVDEFKRGYFPESCPPSSYAVMTFPKTDKTAGDVKLHWMDGGIQPPRPDELGPNEAFGDGGNGILFIGTKGKILADTYAANPRLLPTTVSYTTPKQKYARVKGGADGHWAQWVEGCIAGYGNMQMSSPFEIAGPLTEALLMANLAIRGSDLKVDNKYPGRNLRLLWDNNNMRVTNFDEVNQFVKRNYRPGWEVNYTI
ncbi:MULTISPECIES: Gfo/Idh/MocA family protein [unclassified Sphingobacterium]|uniref:Gfo/Idh/MocA family protein n=1 Tax=unclassified Sphingobacterium TaxID=2609468 RepID=UPI0010493927|nr:MULTISPECIES: Gfo/Idh/MocA family oxidoreductase [unclassified Sphingobacterium]MCS3553739.1 putative dehydrogenase [Sphingobacterium sp. JUb21]TCR01421.1 secreted protein [Sphingobacterium sp. JUb20]